jgi:Glycosyl transferase family 2
MISIVIPLYNKGPDIGRTMASVLNQTFTDWELVVVDDGSRDDGPDQVLACTDPRVRLLRQANAGVSAARNAGAEAARAPLVCFLDADDHWAPDHLGRLVALAAQHPGLGLYAAAFNMVDEQGVVRGIRLPPELAGSQVVITQYFEVAMVCAPLIQTSAVMVNRQAFLAMGGFQRGLAAGEDILLWSRFAVAGPIGFSGFHTSFYVAPPLSAAGRGTAVRRPPDADVVGDALMAMLAQHGQRLKAMRAYVALWFRSRAMLYLEFPDRLAAWRELRKAVAVDGRVHARDLVSVALMALPVTVQRHVLAGLRAARKPA